MTARTLLAWLALVALARDARGQGPTSDVERGLAAHPYLARIEFERFDGHVPYLFLFQKVAGAGPQRSANFVNQVAPVLDATLEQFERQIAQPLALEARAGHERFTVVVLASYGDLENYQRVTRASWHLATWALYDRKLKAVVLFEDAFGQQRSADERARSARHVLLHACQDAWSAAGAAPLEGWVLEGMADAMSMPSQVSGVRCDPSALRTLLADMQDEKRSFTHLRTLEELFFVNEPSRLELFYRTRTPKELEPLDLQDSWWAFYRQASLIFDFLWSDGNGRHRPALLAFLGDVLAGRGTAGAFQERFRPLQAPELEQQFLAWALREHQQTFLVEKLDTERALRALTRAVTSAPEPAAPKLDLSDASPEERLALALHRLASGAERAASAALEALAREPLEAAVHERVERERRRLRLWLELRDAHLDALVASGGTLSFSVDGKPFKAKLLGRDGAELVLDKNRSGRERLAIEALDALELAQEIRPKGTPNDWARLVPYALRDDPRTRKLLKEDGGEGSALLKDARDDYPARLRLGRTLASIEDLTRAPKPTTPAEAEGLLSVVRTLRAEHAELDAVRRKGPALLALAHAWLEAKYALLGEVALLAGKLEVLGGDSVRISYGFRDERELEDFEASKYPVMRTKGFKELEVQDEPFHLEDGKLVASGKATLYSLYDLAPPLSVSYSASYHDLGPDGDRTNYFALGIADDRKEHFVWNIGFHHLEVLEENRVDQAKIPGDYFMDAVYAMQLRHDGKRVTFRCEEQEVSVDAGSRTQGAIFLHAHCEDPLHVTRLVIEGRLVPNSFARLRLRSIEREFATL